MEGLLEQTEAYHHSVGQCQRCSTVVEPLVSLQWFLNVGRHDAPDSIAGRWTNETNEAAVMQIIDSVVASYNIDTAKTLLTGYSMGAKGTWYLAGRNQHRFSAAIPIAGRPADKTDWQIPLYIIHSRQDEVVPLAPTQEYVERLKSNGYDVRLIVIEGVTHFEIPGFAGPLREAVPWIRDVWKPAESS